MRILRRAKSNNDVYNLSYFKALIDAISCYVTQKILILRMTLGGKYRKRELIFNRSTKMCGSNKTMAKTGTHMSLFKVSLYDFSISNLN
jgi:hypothetical protein